MDRVSPATLIVCVGPWQHYLSDSVAALRIASITAAGWDNIGLGWISTQRPLPHTFRTEALQLGIDGVIFPSDDVGTTFGSPCDTVADLLLEEVNRRGSVCCVHKLLFLIRKISGKASGTTVFEPNTAAGYFNVIEDLCFCELVC